MRRWYLLAVVAAVVALCTGIQCPNDLGPNEVTYIPHASNCSAFYRCTKSGPQLRWCPSHGKHGLLCFNNKLKICDWSANVRCCNPFIPDDNSGENTGTAEPPTGQCRNARKKPHTNCLKYVEDGESFCCGRNWAFNSIICQCDLKRNVKSCQPSMIETQQCERVLTDRVSSLARLTDLVYGDKQPLASNDDSFGTPTAE